MLYVVPSVENKYGLWTDAGQRPCQAAELLPAKIVNIYNTILVDWWWIVCNKAIYKHLISLFFFFYVFLCQNKMLRNLNENKNVWPFTHRTQLNNLYLPRPCVVKQLEAGVQLFHLSTLSFQEQSFCLFSDTTVASFRCYFSAFLVSWPHNMYSKHRHYYDTI